MSAARTPGPVGFVGLGDIGKPMAQRLLPWPGGLWVFDIAEAPLLELGAAGAKVAGSVRELAENVDLLCVMVRNDDQVRDVLDQVLAAGRGGVTVAIHSTVAPETPGRLAELAADRGIQVVDAPVSGGAMGAAAGSLALMVGGSDEAFGVCREPFALMGSKVVHAGAVGSGTRMKLARNLLHFVAFTAATEAQRLAEAAGLDLVALGDVVRHTDAITGGPGAIMYRDTAAPMDPNDFFYGPFSHARALGEKDLRFAIELAEELEVDVPLARLSVDRFGPGLGLPERGQGEG